MKFRDFIAILKAEGFTLHRTTDTHRQYVGHVNGERKMVTCDFNKEGEEIPDHNLASMKRQSGLPRKKFR